MDLQRKFEEFQRHVKSCLTSQEINKPDFYAIAVFKALAELTRNGKVVQHTSGAEVVERKALQQQIQTTFPAKGNSRRQEVNKYLSHRYSLSRALEPDFIEFVFDGDSSVYSREDEVEAGSKKTGYRIAEFPQKDALIDYLVALDLKPAYQRLTGDSLLDEVEVMGNTNDLSTPLNQILYGPPGTGKTYHTIEAAVKAAEPTYSWENREELKSKYDALVDAKRIRFVTFHQSFGYEDFVEGLVAETTEDKQVAYRIKDGVFKKICDDAAVSEMHADPAIETNGRVWKLSIEGAHQNATKTYCLENNLGAIGWGDTGDLSKDARNEYFKSQGTNNQNSLMYFCHEMAIGDLVLCIDSKTSVEAVGVVTGEYRYAEEGLPTRDDYCHQLPIKWLAKGFSVDFKSLNDNKQFSLPTCYPLSRLSVGDVLSHLQSHHVQVGETPAASVTAQKQNFVLVIDEINRGNISKIFGELITLIEDSKRGGAEEAVSLTLPYSNKPFSVPDNLYIIGTMNTADRSLAMMDTALRRRFDFVEMMPNPSLLHGAVVKGIHLETLLKTLNERIEILYDREHTLGHAFFMPVKAFLDADDEHEQEDRAFAKLVSVFQNKVIPLLQEYFFEDWHKIRLVLGDNQCGERLQFIGETTLDESKLNALFGAEHELNHYGDAPKRYELKPFTDEVWRQPETYIGIYSPKKEQ
ncbi:AAA family ATPase [Vibrio cholerae]|uniref:AAA family ATPase n=1 Tax=Vibrio cholerae TaxID=666 RepID=UPI000AD0BA34|nr:AAA family ATPase [Vibrio cholerae]